MPIWPAGVTNRRAYCETYSHSVHYYLVFTQTHWFYWTTDNKCRCFAQPLSDFDAVVDDTKIIEYQLGIELVCLKQIGLSGY